MKMPFQNPLFQLLFFPEIIVKHSVVYFLTVWLLQDTWMPLQEFIGNWVKDYESMNYIAGPAYDTNSDGLADTLDQIKRSGKDKIYILFHL